MHFLHILQLLALLTLANGTPIVAKKIFGSRFSFPLDAGATFFDGRPLFGHSKTIRGTVVSILVTTASAPLIGLDLMVGGPRPPRWINTTKIGSGFPQRTDPAAMVIGATGAALARGGTLYVANGVDSAINAIPNATWRSNSAGTGMTITKGGRLNTPLGLIMAPNGDVLTVNGANGLLVETTPSGTQIAKKALDSSGSPPGAGALFGLVLAPHNAGVYYVDDAVNTMRLLH